MKKLLENKFFTLTVLILIYVMVIIGRMSGIINNYYLGIIDMILINLILVVSLNLTVGFLGQLVLGNAGFMAIGAYTSAILTKNIVLPPMMILPVSILLGGILAAIFAILIGIPSLRLRGDYLAIITLGFGEIIKNIINYLKITNGAKGIKNIMTYSKDYGLNDYIDFTVLFIMSMATIFIIKNLVRSRHGRAIRAIREDEIAAEASGINTTYYKIFAFTTSAFFAGIAGALLAHHIGIISANKFDYNYSIEMVIMVVLGGMGSITGSIISVLFLTILPEALRDFSSFRMILYALLLIIAMLVKNGSIAVPFLKKWNTQK